MSYSRDQEDFLGMALARMPPTIVCGKSFITVGTCFTCSRPDGHPNECISNSPSVTIIDDSSGSSSVKWWPSGEDKDGMAIQGLGNVQICCHNSGFGNVCYRAEYHPGLHCEKAGGAVFTWEDHPGSVRVKNTTSGPITITPPAQTQTGGIPANNPWIATGTMNLNGIQYQTFKSILSPPIQIVTDFTYRIEYNTVDAKKYPHNCRECGSRALNLFTSTLCSSKACKFYGVP